MGIQTDWAMIRDQINNAGWGQKKIIKQRFCRALGISEATLHRELNRRFGRKRSIDRDLEIDPDNRIIKMVRDLKIQGEMMHLKRRELATERCLELLMDMNVDGIDDFYSVDENGEINYKVSTVNRRLAQNGFREPQPSKRIEADYANQVHMIDFSRSKYFQMWGYDDRVGDFKMKVSGKELHYKKDDTRLRTWMVQYLDDYSRLRKVRAYAETNESAFLGLDHLNYVYGGTNGTNGTFAPDHPLRYLPLEMLRCDNGSFRRSRETQAAMDALDIHMPPQMPGSKGGTAKVENGFRRLWRRFELPLAVRLGHGNTIWLKDYNDLLAEHCLSELSEQHPYLDDLSKGEAYEKSLADRRITQKTVDMDVIQLACRVERRIVDAHLRVSLDGRYYEVPQYVAGIPTMGKLIAVHKNKYGELKGKLIEDLAVDSFALEPWKAASWGEFSMFKQTEKRLREAEMNREKTGLQDIIGNKRDTVQEGPTPGPSLSRPAQDKEGSVRQMPPRVEGVEVDSVFGGTNGTFAPGSGPGTGRMFRTELQAREFVGVRVKALGLEWKDVSGYFDELVKSVPVAESDLLESLEVVYQDYDSGKLAV